ncbi:MAG: hypothetical protein ACLP5E_24265 [Streptosporangiaceae bacterium]
MTLTDAPARPRPRDAGRVSPMSLWRLLGLELRRNAMPWMFPLLAALFVFDPYRTAMGYGPFWDLRASVLENKLLPDFVAFVAGVAAWMGSRDSRRHTRDLVYATARPRWTAQLITWAATTLWVAAGFLCCVAVLYGVTASQATWGGPPWWPVAVCLAELALISALGFAAGAFFPSRFTAPLAAVGAFLVSLEGFRNAVGRSSAYALLSPTTYVPNDDTGLFHHYLPDLSIAQLMFLIGLTLVTLAALGLPQAADAGPRLRRAAAVIAVAGLAAAGTAVRLTGTARIGTNGTVIPALHDGANDRPIPYTPVCGQAAGVPVCVHPAYRNFLPAVTAALAPVLREIASLPGAPARVDQIAVDDLIPSNGAAITGVPPVFRLPVPATPDERSFGQNAASFTSYLQSTLVTLVVVGAHGFVTYGPMGGTPAQQAVVLALLQKAGTATHTGSGPGNGSHAKADQVAAAATRFAALPATTRHAWLAAHLAALRAGGITLAQLP